MATHFTKFRALPTGNMKKPPTQSYIEKMIVREPARKPHRMHPRAIEKWNRMLEPLEPLKYKLQELPEKDNTKYEPMGYDPEIPFQVSLSS